MSQAWLQLDLFLHKDLGHAAFLATWAALSAGDYELSRRFLSPVSPPLWIFSPRGLHRAVCGLSRRWAEQREGTTFLLSPQPALLPTSLLGHDQGKCWKPHILHTKGRLKHSSENTGVYCCAVLWEWNLKLANSVLNLLTIASYCYIFNWKGQLRIAPTDRGKK